MNNCKACNGTGLQWMGDFSIGTEYQDTCYLCEGRKVVATPIQVHHVRDDLALAQWVWEDMYPERRKFNQLEPETRKEWEKFVRTTINFYEVSKILPYFEAQCETYQKENG